MDAATIRNFLACYHLVPLDSHLPADRAFERNVPFRAVNELSDYVATIRINEELAIVRETSDDAPTLGIALDYFRTIGHDLGSLVQLTGTDVCTQYRAAVASTGDQDRLQEDENRRLENLAIAESLGIAGFAAQQPGETSEQRTSETEQTTQPGSSASTAAIDRDREAAAALQAQLDAGLDPEAPSSPTGPSMQNSDGPGQDHGPTSNGSTQPPTNPTAPQHSIGTGQASNGLGAAGDNNREGPAATTSVLVGLRAYGVTPGTPEYDHRQEERRRASETAAAAHLASEAAASASQASPAGAQAPETTTGGPGTAAPPPDETTHPDEEEGEDGQASPEGPDADEQERRRMAEIFNDGPNYPQGDGMANYSQRDIDELLSGLVDDPDR